MYYNVSHFAWKGTVNPISNGKFKKGHRLIIYHHTDPSKRKM